MPMRQFGSGVASQSHATIIKPPTLAPMKVGEKRRVTEKLSLANTPASLPKKQKVSHPTTPAYTQLFSDPKLSPAITLSPKKPLPRSAGSTPTPSAAPQKKGPPQRLPKRIPLPSPSQTPPSQNTASKTSSGAQSILNIIQSLQKDVTQLKEHINITTQAKNGTPKNSSEFISFLQSQLQKCEEERQTLQSRCLSASAQYNSGQEELNILLRKKEEEVKELLLAQIESLKQSKGIHGASPLPNSSNHHFSPEDSDEDILGSSQESLQALCMTQQPVKAKPKHISSPNTKKMLLKRPTQLKNTETCKWPEISQSTAQQQICQIIGILKQSSPSLFTVTSLGSTSTTISVPPSPLPPSISLKEKEAERIMKEEEEKLRRQVSNLSKDIICFEQKLQLKDETIQQLKEECKLQFERSQEATEYQESLKKRLQHVESKYETKLRAVTSLAVELKEHLAFQQNQIDLLRSTPANAPSSLPAPIPRTEKDENIPISVSAPSLIPARIEKEDIAPVPASPPAPIPVKVAVGTSTPFPSPSHVSANPIPFGLGSSPSSHQENEKEKRNSNASGNGTKDSKQKKKEGGAPECPKELPKPKILEEIKSPLPPSASPEESMSSDVSMSLGASMSSEAFEQEGQPPEDGSIHLEDEGMELDEKEEGEEEEEIVQEILSVEQYAAQAYAISSFDEKENEEGIVRSPMIGDEIEDFDGDETLVDEEEGEADSAMEDVDLSLTQEMDTILGMSQYAPKNTSTVNHAFSFSSSPLSDPNADPSLREETTRSALARLEQSQ